MDIEGVLIINEEHFSTISGRTCTSKSTFFSQVGGDADWSLAVPSPSGGYFDYNSIITTDGLVWSTKACINSILKMSQRMLTDTVHFSGQMNELKTNWEDTWVQFSVFDAAVSQYFTCVWFILFIYSFCLSLVWIITRAIPWYLILFRLCDLAPPCGLAPDWWNRGTACSSQEGSDKVGGGQSETPEGGQRGLWGHRAQTYIMNVL